MGLVSNKGGLFIFFFFFLLSSTWVCYALETQSTVMSDSENTLPWPPCSGSWQNIHSDCSTVIIFVAVGKMFTVTIPLSSCLWQLAKCSQWLFRCHPTHGSWQNIHSDCSAVILFIAVGKTFTVTVPLSSYLWQLAKCSQWLFCCHPIHSSWQNVQWLFSCHPICDSWQNIHSDCSTIILQRTGLKFVIQWKHFLQKPSTHPCIKLPARKTPMKQLLTVPLSHGQVHCFSLWWLFCTRSELGSLHCKKRRLDQLGSVPGLGLDRCGLGTNRIEKIKITVIMVRAIIRQ